MFDREKNDKNNFWGYYFYVYIPIIRTTDNLNKASSPEDFKFTRFSCISYITELTTEKSSLCQTL